MGIRTSTRLLGLYVLLCVAYQARVPFFPDSFYLTNPRIGLEDWTPHRWFQTAYWTSAVWLSVIAVTVFALPTRRILQLYVAQEVVISLPTILFILEAYLVRSGFGGFGNELLKDTELQTQFAVFLGFSIMPAVLGMLILRDARFALRLGVSLVLSLLAFPLLALFTRELLLGLVATTFILIRGILWAFENAKCADEVA